MSPAEAAAFLRRYNEWRRGELDDLSMPDPREIGEAIDAAVEMIDRLEAAEKERDDLKAKIAEMEKQDPVTWHVWGKVAVGSMAAYSIPLYALPGAKGE